MFSSFPGLGEQITEFVLPDWSIERRGVMERAVNAVSQVKQEVSKPGNLETLLRYIKRFL